MDVSSRVQRPENLGPYCLRSGRDGHPTSRSEWVALPLPLCSIWTLSGLDLAPHVGESDLFLFSLLIHMLISSGHTLTDTPRNNVLSVMGHALVQSSWHKINHHTWVIKSVLFSFQIFGNFPKILLLFISNLILLFSESIICMTWIFLNVMKLDLRPRICLCWWMSHVYLEKKKKSFAVVEWSRL